MWFSQVTTWLVFLIELSIVSSSNGFIVLALISSADMPSSFNFKTAFNDSALETGELSPATSIRLYWISFFLLFPVLSFVIEKSLDVDPLTLEF